MRMLIIILLTIAKQYRQLKHPKIENYVKYVTDISTSYTVVG